MPSADDIEIQIASAAMGWLPDDLIERLQRQEAQMRRELEELLTPDALAKLDALEAEFYRRALLGP